MTLKLMTRKHFQHVADDQHTISDIPAASDCVLLHVQFLSSDMDFQSLEQDAPTS